MVITIEVRVFRSWFNFHLAVSLFERPLHKSRVNYNFEKKTENHRLSTAKSVQLESLVRSLTYHFNTNGSVQEIN